MLKKDEQAFEYWVSVEDREGGVFENNNNFTRDEWIAKKAWAAALKWERARLNSSNNDECDTCGARFEYWNK